MTGITGLVIGISLIVISLVVILSSRGRGSSKEMEFNIEDYTNNNNVDSSDEIASAINSLEDVLEEMNDTFNSTVNQFEKKYALMENRLKELDNKVDEGIYSTVEDVEIFSEDDIIEDSPMDNRVFAIKKLKEMGMSNSQIAKELNIGKGEVNLIANIMEKSDV